MNRKILLFGLLIILGLAGCKKNTQIVRYHSFKDMIWNRFEILKFDFSITDISKPYDIIFFADHTQNYVFDNLDFNMAMTTPSGEERIREYHFPIKTKSGTFTGNCTPDSCSVSIPIKQGLWFDKKGVVKFEIETLVPRLQVGELLGVGIRLVRVSK